MLFVNEQLDGCLARTANKISDSAADSAGSFGRVERVRVPRVPALSVRRVGATGLWERGEGVTMDCSGGGTERRKGEETADMERGGR